MIRDSFVQKMNKLGSKREPFLFVLSYDGMSGCVQSLDSLDEDIYYKLEEWRNYPAKKFNGKFKFSKHPIEFMQYKRSLDAVLEQIAMGNTYLLNLTFQTPVESSLGLEEIFRYSKAKFKLYYKGEFVCFSPERFVQIDDNMICAYPMKGTIDANLPNAKEQILQDPKEMAEHVMIVDLMRNDLGIVGESVKVESFRYVEKVKAGKKDLLQISSKVTAKLPADWNERIGSILDSLLPAGSVTGTPKKRTVEIINEIENYDRGFYTGVFGLFDGNSLRSGVMIRFIQNENNRLFYKSGGGITADSDAVFEYEELIDKIYLPI